VILSIPSSEWPSVLQRVAQEESLRQIERRYHTSYEAVRRRLNASRKERLQEAGEPEALPPEDAAEEFSKE
jgi:hypothetical protein